MDRKEYCRWCLSLCTIIDCNELVKDKNDNVYDCVKDYWSRPTTAVVCKHHALEVKGQAVAAATGVVLAGAAYAARDMIPSSLVESIPTFGLSPMMLAILGGMGLAYILMKVWVCAFK